MPKSMNYKASITPNGTVVLREPEGGLGKIRCPRCGTPAPAVRAQDGSLVNHCPSCGTTWTRTAMK